MDIRIRIDADKAREGFARAPDVMTRHLDAKLGRGAAEIAREAQQRVSKVFSTLWASIRSLRVASLHWRVQTGVNYARAVEEGTKPGYLPNPVHLRAWIKARHGIGFAHIGSNERGAQYDEIHDRAWALARFIQAHGTKPHPYMKPAAEAKRSRVIQLAEEGVRDGLKEIFG